MAILTQQAGWRRVRAPLVALDAAEYARLQSQMQAFALDRNQD
jgi:4-hydroxy-tetrahydrodipicolinate synthase